MTEQQSKQDRSAEESVTTTGPKQHWYNKNWLVITLLIVLCPVGLYGLWKNQSEQTQEQTSVPAKKVMSRGKKIGLGCLASIFGGFIILTILGGIIQGMEKSKATAIVTPLMDSAQKAADSGNLKEAINLSTKAMAVNHISVELHGKASEFKSKYMEKLRRQQEPEFNRLLQEARTALSTGDSVAAKKHVLAALDYDYVPNRQLAETLRKGIDEATSQSKAKEVLGAMTKSEVRLLVNEGKVIGGPYFNDADLDALFNSNLLSHRDQALVWREAEQQRLRAEREAEQNRLLAQKKAEEERMRQQRKELFARGCKTLEEYRICVPVLKKFYETKVNDQGNKYYQWIYLELSQFTITLIEKKNKTIGQINIVIDMESPKNRLVGAVGIGILANAMANRNYGSDEYQMIGKWLMKNKNKEGAVKKLPGGVYLTIEKIVKDRTGHYLLVNIWD